MGVIDADDLSFRGAGRADGVEMVPRMDEKTGLARLQVAGRMSGVDASVVPDEEPAALGGHLRTGMSDDGVERATRDVYDASTTIAIPIPPPMHRDATP